MSDLPKGHPTEELKGLVKTFMRSSQSQLKTTGLKAKGRSGKIFIDSEKKFLYTEDGYHDNHVEIWEVPKTGKKAKHKGIRKIEYVKDPATIGQKFEKVLGLKWGPAVSGGSHPDLELIGSM